jgi:quercetin dioxygenase-like cupin family protein
MNKMIILVTMLMTLTLISCNNPSSPETSNRTAESEELIFPRGELIHNNNFTGKAWLTSLVVADSVNTNAVGVVTFEPGARTNWHLHPAGQIVIALSGTGYYQEEDSPKEILHKGDVVKCPPDIPHWHGAGPHEEFVQMAITGRQNGPTEWLHAVSDEEYNAHGD